MTPPVPPGPEPPGPGPEPDPPTILTYERTISPSGLTGSTVYVGVQIDGSPAYVEAGAGHANLTDLMHYVNGNDEYWLFCTLASGIGIDLTNPRATSGYYGYALISYSNGYTVELHEDGVGMQTHTIVPSDLPSIIASGNFEMEAR